MSASQWLAFFLFSESRAMRMKSVYERERGIERTPVCVCVVMCVWKCILRMWHLHGRSCVYYMSVCRRVYACFGISSNMRCLAHGKEMYERQMIWIWNALKSRQNLPHQNHSAGSKCDYWSHAIAITRFMLTILLPWTKTPSVTSSA